MIIKEYLLDTELTNSVTLLSFWIVTLSVTCAKIATLLLLHVIETL